MSTVIAISTNNAYGSVAIDGAEARGQLRRLTGKGFSGTFELVDGANKTGGKYEDAIENAIISMNEPKQVSVTGIRDYLSECYLLPLCK